MATRTPTKKRPARAVKRKGRAIPARAKKRVKVAARKPGPKPTPIFRFDLAALPPMLRIGDFVRDKARGYPGSRVRRF